MNRFPECADCAFNNVEPTICEDCEDADQFEYAEVEDSSVSVIHFQEMKEAA